MSRILTLNIGASKAVLAEYAVSGKSSLSLMAYGSAEIPAVDVNDPGALGAVLPTAIQQIMREKGIRPAPLVVSLGGQMVFPRFAKFPPLGDAEKLAQLVRYEIEQNVPFPIDEIVSDYQFLGETPDGDKAAIIVAAKLEGVRAVTDAVRASNLRPKFVDVSPVAICNVLKFANPQLTGCSVVLDIGAKTTNLIIVEGEKIYNRSIQVAGNTITKDLVQTFGCSFAEAEQLKIERGYVALGGVTEDEDEVADQVSKVIRTVLTRLHAEISRSINFYRSQQGGSAPTRLYLTGGTARLPQLAEFFMESLQVEVEYLNPFGRIGFGSKINKAALEADVFALTESVGLALRATANPWIAINLMPPEIIEEARAFKRIPFLVFGGLAFLAALAAAWLAESKSVEVAKAKIECVEGKNGTLSGLESQLKAQQKKTDEACAQNDEFQKLLRSRSAALSRVQAVRESLIPGMWITKWEAIVPKADDEEGPKAEGAKVTIRGWTDVMDKAEDDWATRNAGKKRKVAAEIVEAALLKCAEINTNSVKIVTQQQVKQCLMEFAIQMEFAEPPSAVAQPEKKGGKGKAAQE